MTTEQERHEAAYMEALRSTVIKITYGGTGGDVYKRQIGEYKRTSFEKNCFSQSCLNYVIFNVNNEWGLEACYIRNLKPS